MPVPFGNIGIESRRAFAVRGHPPLVGNSLRVMPRSLACFRPARLCLRSSEKFRTPLMGGGATVPVLETAEPGESSLPQAPQDSSDCGPPEASGKLLYSRAPRVEMQTGEHVKVRARPFHFQWSEEFKTKNVAASVNQDLCQDFRSLPHEPGYCEFLRAGLLGTGIIDFHEP